MTSPADDPELAALLTPLREADDLWLQLVRTAEQPVGGRSIGDYEILDEIRHGGQALVFRARHLATGREVALKRMAFGVFATPAERRRFEREVDAVLSLQHPGIVTVYGIDKVGGVDVLAMEWVVGERLDAWAAHLPENEAGLRRKLDAFLQICDAVQHAHQRGVIHRDLKPSNVLVDAEGRCRVLDFGLARRLSDHDDAGVSRTLGFVGTPAFAAPEHFLGGAAPIDVRSDVYSLGVMLYQLVTGRLPFAADALGTLIQEIERAEPPRPSSLVRGLDRDLDAIVACAMAKGTGDRYPTAHALAEDVRAHLAGRTVTAVAPSAAYVAAKWVRRHRTVTVLSLLLLLLAAAAAGGGIVQAGRIRAERDTAKEERDRAKEARDLATTQAAKARAVADFYLDLVTEATPSGPDPRVDFLAVLQRAAARARDHFAAHLAWAVEVEANLAQTLARRGQFDEAVRMAQASLELQRTLDDGIPTATGLLLRVLGDSKIRTGDVAGAVPLFEEALAVYRDSGELLPRTLSATHHSLGAALNQLERGSEAEQHFRAGMRIAADGGAADNELGCRAALANLLMDRGAFDEALELLEAARALAERSGASEQALWSIHSSLGGLFEERGEPERAVAELRRSVEIAARILTETHPERALSHFRFARALLAAKAQDEATVHFERALGLGLTGMELAIAHEKLAVIAAGQEQLARAAEHHAAAWTAFAAAMPATSGQRVVAYANWLRAMIAAGDVGRARTELAGLLAELESCARHGGWPQPLCWSRVHELGRYLGEEPAARAALREALHTLQRGEAAGHPQVAEIQQLLDRL